MIPGSHSVWELRQQAEAHPFAPSFSWDHDVNDDDGEGDECTLKRGRGSG